MKKAAMNRKKRLDAPSKQELRERYESARRQNIKEDTKEDLLSSTSELPKRPREDQDIQAESSDLRDKIPKLSRTIAGNDETGSLVVNVGKTNPSAPFSLVDPSYDDNRTSVEMFDYSHKRSDTDPVGEEDDLRSLIVKQRKTDKQGDVVSKKDDKNPKKTGSTFYDSKVGYSKDNSKSKTLDNYRDSKRKESKDSKSSSGKSDRYSKHDGKSKTKKGKEGSKSSYELGFPFFSGSGGTKKTDKPAEEMDINETLKELAYLRSIQTGDNALPKEEEEYFRKLNDLSNPSLVSQFDLIMTGTDAGKQKADGGKKTANENLSKIESKWDSVIDSMVGTKSVGNITSDDEITYGPSLPPKKQSSTSKKLQDKSPERKFSRERSLSNSKSDQKTSPTALRGVRGGRGFRGRGMRGSFRGRGRGRGRGAIEFAAAVRGRGRGRSRGRFIRGGFIPSRGRHIFAKGGTKSRRSRSRSSSRSRSRSSSYSRSRSRSRSRGRSNKRRRSSSRSSYSSSSYSRSRSRSRDRGRGRKQTKRRSRSRSYSSRSRSRSKSPSRSRRRSQSRSTTHSRSHKRSRSSSRSRGSYKKQSKDRARSRSRSKSSSRSRSRKRKDRSRSRSWSFDEDYTKKKNTKNTSGTKTADTKGTAKKEQELKIQSKPKKDKTETEMVKPKINKDKVWEPKLEQSNQIKGKTKGKITENAPEKSFEKPKAEDSNSPAVVALKDLKVTAFSNVFLPRTVSKTVGNISKGMSIGKGRTLPLKKHPFFDAQEEEPHEEPEKIDPKELERMKQEKQKFDNEVDKVFNAKQESKNTVKKRGSWKRVGSPEESPKKEELKEQQEQKEAELGNNKYEEIEEKKVVEDQRIVESKDTTEEKKTEKEQKKERKEKRRKEKEEKSKRKKEKKEKKEKKNKESNNQENLGNESKDNVLGDDGQALLDSSKQEQYDQEEYSGYNEYPEGEYQYYEETGQEQGWYDENGVYHPYEEEYLYYYDQEGNIVGYEGPEGYVEGNPFEEQQYYYEGEQQGVQPEVYGQEAYGTEYTGDAEGYHYPVEGQVAEGAQYTGTDNHWQEYAGEAPEQQWYGAEGSYSEGGEAYMEYQYAEGQEGNQYQGDAIEQPVPAQQDTDYMVQQGDSLQSFDTPVQATEEPKTEGDISESELVLALGKNLAALARLKGWNQQELLDQDPLSLVQMLQKPSPAEKPPPAAQEQHPEEPRRQLQQNRPLEEPNRQFEQEIKLDEVPRQQPQGRQAGEARMQYPQERKLGINERRAAEKKPLKSILKKGNSTSLKPPPKTETSTASPLTKSVPSASTSDHVGPEYIVCISKSGPERFFCKLCQCHIESSMAKELHVKSMKHIELFVREKSFLLHSVIGAKQMEDAAGPGFPSQQDKLPEEREPSPPRSPDRDIHKNRDTSEEDSARNRLLDYDRLRLMDWQRREGSVSSVESDKPKQFDYGRTDDQDFESRTSRGSAEHERYEDRNEHARWPRERREADWKQDEQGYGRERQHYSPEHRERDYEKGDYDRERLSLSRDSDHQDDRRSVGSRSSDRSFDGSEKGSRQDHKVQPMAYRNRMPQDVRPSAHDRPGINQGESSRAALKEQPSRQEQAPGREGSDTKRLNRNERERSRGDTSVHGRGRTSFPPPKNRGQAEEQQWHGHGQASRQDNTQQGLGQKAEETSSHSSSSSRIPSSDRKEMPRAEGTGRRTEQSVKASEKISQSSPVLERNQGQQGHKTSKDSNSNSNTGSSLKDDRDMSQKPAERHSERAGIKPIPSIQSRKEAQEGKRRPGEPQQQAPSSTNVMPSAALLGDQPKSHIPDQKPQEEVKSISTVIQGQRRVPPPPPPYNKGSGPQSFRGRGGQGHPPAPGGRGGYQSHVPLNQPGMTSKPPQSLLQMPPQAPSYEVRAPAPSSGMPPRQHFPSDQSMVKHPTPPYYGRGRAAGQPQFRGRGGSPHMSRGGYGGPPQYASRGRGGRGFHGQRW